MVADSSHHPSMSRTCRVPFDKSTKKPAIFLMGATASGKTDLAVELVTKHPCEIISVDTTLVYRGMNIGSAKPNPHTLALAPHHLIDIRDPNQSYSVAEFCQDALRLMDEISQRGKIPLLTGGSMMYFKALEQGLANLPASKPEMREQLIQEIATQGIQALYQQLTQIDPISAQRLKPTDTQRIMRALEVYRISGIPLSQYWQQQTRYELPYQVLKIGLWPKDRHQLHQRINQRFHLMLEQGFEQETRALIQHYHLTSAHPAMRSVGYRQMGDYIQGDIDYATMTDKAIAATRQLAKRQLTWLRKWPDLHHIDILQQKNSFTALELLDRILT